MEHEVFVPVPAESLRAVLCDPLRVARALPGFQRDASGDGGRLKVRIGGTAITYRGSVQVTETPDGSFTLTGDGTEARGTGAVAFELTARVAASDGGSRVTFTGTGTGDGRVAELDEDAVTSAAQRLLGRFAENLGTESQDLGADEPEDELADDADDIDDAEGIEGAGGAEGPEGAAGPEALSVFDTEVPPSSLGPETDFQGDYEGEFENGELPAEPAAAHARRTMIGRSAEEVDHAPPRGRYAPVPGPEGAAASATLRWAAPAAALVVASVIVVGRALRRRR
ncbi:SRPBCC domain-containing protein [Streptomyces xanthii]|uniref:SRPBCC family protein n=1 Tax=Streptomyces xanthii TaxID=2768069 RepID=A0A7H1B9N3_9ACTN|nr:SRPBCC domain-containing protein [Streptomyces xanthii]QNS05438.1 SRPBCC family protein [Streptomyces xanthii]